MADEGAGPPAVPTDLPTTGLGLAVLLVERLGGAAAHPAFQTSVGLAVLGTERARRLVDRAVDRARPGPTARGWLDRAGRLPGAALVRRPLDRARTRVGAVTDAARVRGAQTMESARRQALQVIGSNTDDALSWAEEQAAPRLIDGVLPRLTVEVVPRVITSVVPQIRTEVLPVIMSDLAADPGVRDLVMEQSRGVLDDAANQVREGTAAADDRVESLARRLFRRAPG
jgi:hypothetical protein